MNTTFIKPKRLKYKNTFLLLFFILLFLPSCKEDPSVIPPPPPPVLKDTLTISVTDVTHRSTSLNVQCTMNNVQSQIRLYRLFNSTETLVSEFPITVQDTTIIDDNNGTGLLLNTNYFYYAVRIDTLGERKDTSNIAEAATLDTTSHNYTWQEIVIGEWQSALYDVWGTDENNVWAVGGVRINDTTYGVLKWNGVEWLPEKKIGGLQSIYGFSSTDIWTVGGGVWHYDGNMWTSLTQQDPVFNANIPYTSIWGTSSSNLYLGNMWGKIIYWDGSKASDLGKISEYGITGIVGINNTIYITASTVAGSSPCELFLFDGAIFHLIKRGSINPGTEELLGPFNDVWTYDGKELYIPGNTINIRRNNIWTRHTPNFFITSIQGNKSNNIFATGHFGGVTHYNGMTWLRYNNIFDTSTVLTGVKVFQNSVFIVGLNSSQAFIYKGTIQ